MRIVVMGTGPFAVPMFAALRADGHEIPSLITRPVPPAVGRKKETAVPNPMRDEAERAGIAVLAPTTANCEEVRALLRSWLPDLLVVCDYGEILAAETLATSRHGGINLHASLLPKFRGAAPINWAILRGEKETGVSVIHMTPKLDGGPLLAVCRTPIGREETTAQLEPRLAQLGVEPVRAAIRLLSGWDGSSPLGAPQNPDEVTSARRLRKSDGDVRWERTTTRIMNQIRGLKPWPGSFTHLHSDRAQPVRLILDTLERADFPQENAVPGTAIANERRALLVKTGNGGVSLIRVQPAGKRIMEIADFLRGRDPAETLRCG